MSDVKEYQFEWLDGAECKGVDPAIFFPEKYESTHKQAKAICQACDVRVECLQYALDTGERHGIWGGVSERERRRIQHMGVTATEYFEGISNGTIQEPRRGRPKK